MFTPPIASSAPLASPTSHLRSRSAPSTPTSKIRVDSAASSAIDNLRTFQLYNEDDDNGFISTSFDPRAQSITGYQPTSTRLVQHDAFSTQKVTSDGDPHKEMSSYTFLGKDGKLYEISYHVQTGTNSKQKCIASREIWAAHAEQLMTIPGLLKPGCDKNISIRKEISNILMQNQCDVYTLTDPDLGDLKVNNEFAQSYFSIPLYKEGRLREPVESAHQNEVSTQPIETPDRLFSHPSNTGSAIQDELSRTGSHSSDDPIKRSPRRKPRGLAFHVRRDSDLSSTESEDDNSSPRGVARSRRGSPLAARVTGDSIAQGFATRVNQNHKTVHFSFSNAQIGTGQ